MSFARDGVMRSFQWLCICLLALAGELSGSDAHLQSQEPVVGNQTEFWYGVLKTPAQWLRTSLQFKTKPDGTVEGTAVSHDQKSPPIPLTTIERKDGQWTIEFKASGAKFVGKESEDGKSVEGTFSQRGSEFPIKFERLEKLPPMEGKSVYRGELNAFVRKLLMQVRVIKGEQFEGKQLVLVDSLNEGFGSFVGNLTVDGEQIVINVPALASTWKGKAKLEDKSWEGTWTQGLVPLSLTWNLAEEPLEYVNVAKKRPQTPKAPFPYDATDVEIVSAAGVKLAATLSLPKSERKVPGVILISGSGPQDRNESLLDHQPFGVIADFLSRKGIAVLRYDDRGVGKSTGDFAAAVTDDFIADASAAWEFLAKQPQVDSAKIGLLGHSEGSSVAISVGAENSRVAFLVLMAGAGWDGRKIVVEQTVEMAKRQQSNAKALDALRAMMETHSEVVLQNLETEKFEARVDEIVATFLDDSDIPEDSRELAKESLSARLKQLSNAWYRDFLTRDPSQTLPKVKRPILAVWGSEDVQVPATGNRDAMKSAIGSSPHPLTKLEILPGMNHLLQPCKTGLVDEYESIEVTIDPVALEMFADFILKATGN